MGLAQQLAGTLPTSNLLPVDLAAAVALVAGAQIAGGKVSISATSTSAPAPSAIPGLAAQVSTSIAQVLVLASTITAVDVPSSGDAISLIATSNIAGTTSGAAAASTRPSRPLCS